MTLEEAVQAAESGNVSAMNSLGDYYVEQNEYLEANTWFSKAASAGSPYGIHQSMLCDMMLAMADEDLGLWQDALDRWNAARAKALVLVQNEGVAEDFKTSARTHFLNTIVIGLGLGNTMTENYDAAIAWLKESDDNRAKVLLGLCYYKRGGDGDLLQACAEAFPLLKILNTEPDMKIATRIKWLCWNTLAFIYRVGDSLADPSVKTDLAASYHCLEMALNLPDLSEKQAVFTREELKKYSKGLFGSYTYNG